MTRKRAAAAGIAAVWLAAEASPAAGHGLGGRLDLPVPISLFIYGAAVVVVVSFVALGALRRTPKLEERREGRPLPAALQRVLTGPVPDAVVRTLSVLVFGLVVAAAVGGRDSSANIAPWIVYIWFWVGLAFAHALLGNWWATLSPWDSIARFLGIGEEPGREYPPAWGTWPAAILLFGFLVMELVLPSGESPRLLGWGIGVYTAVTLGGMARYGRDAWNRGGEAFAVYLGLLARIAPVSRREDGAVVLRPFLAGLPHLEPRPGLVAVTMVAIGSTTFDGFTGTAVWTGWTDGLAPVPLALAGGAGLLGMVLLAAGVYALSMRAASVVAGTPWHPLAARFVHSLIPIAFAYVAAHYFSLLVLEGQTVFSLISDPFGRGWNLVGTAGYDVNYALLTKTAVWYVQVAVIVLGHIAGVVLAHDRALAMFPDRTAIRTQYALLGVMVLFTMAGLGILSGG